MPKQHICTPIVKYISGSIMLYVKYYNLKFTQAWIPEKHIYDDKTKMYGYESEPHITLLNGVETGFSVKSLQTILKSVITPVTVEINTQLNTFEPNDKGACALKYDLSLVSGKVLTNIHNQLKQSIPNTYSYDEYNPHMTVAYIKDKYRYQYGLSNVLNNNIISHTNRYRSKQPNQTKKFQVMDSMYYVYTTPNGDKWVIDI